MVRAHSAFARPQPGPGSPALPNSRASRFGDGFKGRRTGWPDCGSLAVAEIGISDELPISRLRIVDGTSISRAGDDGTTWRIHASFDPATACFTDLQVTGADVGEGFARFSFKSGDLAVADRFYAKTPGLQHVLVLQSGADFLVRVGWNSMRMGTADGTRLDLASIYTRMAPGETKEVSVLVTGRNKGQGRKPRRLFPRG